MAKKQTERRIELMRLGELKGNAANPKDHDIGEISASLDRFGYVEAVTVDERTGKLVAGHGRVETLLALKNAKKPPPPGVEMVDGDWAIPVQRGWSSKNDREAKAYLVASNRLSEIGGWNQPSLDKVLLELSRAGEQALKGTGYDAADVDRIMRELVPPDEQVIIPEKPWVKLGDRFKLGDHLLICGDSRDPKNWEPVAGEAACLWTDPPYGVDYVGKTKEALEIQNDDAAGLAELLRTAFAAVTVALKPGAALYVASPAGPNCVTFYNEFVGAGWRLHETLIWMKDSMVLGHSDYHYQHEPILFGYAQGGGRRGRGGEGWYGGADQTTKLEVPRPKVSAEHPTMKPIALVAIGLRNSTQRGDLVVEPFSGSGSTLIACETLGRRCRAVELEPRFAQATVERWEKLTGRKREAA